MKITRTLTYLTFVAAAWFAPVHASAQNDAKFHMELDYAYHLGLTEKLSGYNYKSEGKLGGHALTLNALYNLKPNMTVGAGFGLSRFKREYNGDSFTMPLYATFRYRPLASHLPFYAFTDVGCTLFNRDDNHNFTGGLMGTIGAGYQLMLKRHFGLNFKVGYNIQQFANTPIYNNNIEKSNEDGTIVYTSTLYDKRSLWRHSIQLGVGLVF